MRCVCCHDVLWLCLLAAVLPVWADTPSGLDKSFQAQQETIGQEFADYQEGIEQAFAAYKKAYQEEFALYKGQVEAQWGEFYEGGANLWVSYEEEMQVRRVVDFERGAVQVSVLVEPSEDLAGAKARVKTSIDKLLNSTQKDAYNADQFSVRLEARLQASVSEVLTGQPSEMRLFSKQDLAGLDYKTSPYIKVTMPSTSPVQWNVTESMSGDKNIVTAGFIIPHSLKDKADRYYDNVVKVAVKERLPAELILAVIETESSFNPMAKSHVPAYGLMQIVPRSAGKDATRYLYGESKVLAPSYLYEVDKNIRVGAAYLHVLYYRYMKKIKDPVSRLYCAIAAYNTGASNVGFAFIGKKSFSKSVDEINRMTSDEVFQTLVENLPYVETRKYVKKVSSRMGKYVKEI